MKESGAEQTSNICHTEEESPVTMRFVVGRGLGVGMNRIFLFKVGPLGAYGKQAGPSSACGIAVALIV